MNDLIIRNARVVTEESVLPSSTLVCREGRFIDNADEQPDGQVYDARGRYLVPGYIDLHMHGVLGRLVDSGKAALEEICRVLPRYGVTGFLPSVTPCADDPALLRDLAAARSDGSEILGFFLEGHYLKLSGAIRDIPTDYSSSRVRALREAAEPFGIVFGVSPEIPELAELFPIMVESGFSAFITHTEANVEQTILAIGLGARHATHFYDVFPYPGEQEPGVRGCGAVEAVLANPRVTVDFILDGEHVAPVAVKMALAAKGPGGVCLITDSNICAGLPPGTYGGLGEDEIVMHYPGGPARMSEKTREPGGLAGSGLTMDLAVRNAVRLLGISLPRAVRMASLNPAAVLGLQNRKGRITPGFDADFALLDENLAVNACFVAGKKVFDSEEEI